MKWDDVGDIPCSVARSLSLIGDRWTLMILRNAFLGMRRFQDFQTTLGLTRHLLASRLKRLVEAGILVRVPYQQRPLRHEYRLTEKGNALHPVLLALTAWGDAWLDEGDGPPVLLRHETCSQLMQPVSVCSECHEPLTPETVQALPGPGRSGDQLPAAHITDSSRTA